LVVVGGGISGLAAAYFLRPGAGPRPRVLICDNHEDCGGHAKRNEFRSGGRLRLGYGGHSRSRRLPDTTPRPSSGCGTSGSRCNGSPSILTGTSFHPCNSARGASLTARRLGPIGWSGGRRPVVASIPGPYPPVRSRTPSSRPVIPPAAGRFPAWPVAGREESVLGQDEL
jgi:hypothetical protein